MAEMEDKLQEILGNEDAMSQIMSLAQSFSNPESPLASPRSTGGIGEMLGEIDPRMISMGMRMVSAYQDSHRTVDLMQALRPFVGEERHQMMDRIATATKLAKVVTCVLAMIGERGDDDV